MIIRRALKPVFFLVLCLGFFRFSAPNWEKPQNPSIAEGLHHFSRIDTCVVIGVLKLRETCVCIEILSLSTCNHARSCFCQGINSSLQHIEIVEWMRFDEE